MARESTVQKMNDNVRAGNPAYVLCKSSKCSLPRSHTSCPMIVPLLCVFTPVIVPLLCVFTTESRFQPRDCCFD